MVHEIDTDILGEVEIDDSEDSGDEEKDEGKSLEKEKKHKKLLNDLGEKLGHKKKREFSTSRTEPCAEVSEYTWSSAKDKVSLQDLVSVLDSSNKSVSKVKKKLKKMENKTKPLAKPLEKVHRERVERSVAYDETATDLGKWQGTVQKNREADQLIFPLNNYKPPPASTKNMLQQFTPQTEMEKAISEVLTNNKHLLERKDKELTEAEEKALALVDLEEAMERRKELQRTRALQSYYEVKRHRAKKIKSKKYHRMLKKEEEKKMSKVDLEALSKENPALFASEMEKAEQMRAKERANLRHRNTSKWAKNLITKGHKSKDDQDRIREQLRVSRELTDHKTVVDSDEEMDGNIKDGVEDSVGGGELSLLKKQNDGEDNPWLLDAVESSSAPASGKLLPIKSAETLNEDEDKDEDDDEDEEEEELLDEWEQAGREQGAETENNVEINNDEINNVQSNNEEVNNEEKNGSETVDKKSVSGKGTKSNKEAGNAAVNTLKLICENVKLNEVEETSNLKSKSRKRKKKQEEVVLEMAVEDGSSDDDEDFTLDNTEQAMNINEAFANDDVVADFVKEKNELIEKSKPKAVDLTLPGWGEWGGPGLKISKNKRKKFIKEPGPAPKRKDDGNTHVIINERNNESFAKHQVTGVPFPYTNKVEFERSIRQPIGGHWNTPSVHGKLIEPKVRIVPGVAIAPIKATKRMKKRFKKELEGNDKKK